MYIWRAESEEYDNMPTSYILMICLGWCRCRLGSPQKRAYATREEKVITKMTEMAKNDWNYNKNVPCLLAYCKLSFLSYSTTLKRHKCEWISSQISLVEWKNTSKDIFLRKTLSIRQSILHLLYVGVYGSAGGCERNNEKNQQTMKVRINGDFCIIFVPSMSAVEGCGWDEGESKEKVFHFLVSLVITRRN